ncbi:hypothetical protein SAMN05216326_1529 [Nitrosomonas marina]|uniref:TspB protein n=1 Tax=Nitrosomonas marina TaxID=917 RepID=A0A1I0G3E9_9PROT|nr:virulence factor TspB C-terminal domain-related protein [Nitrosomonas marina]SET65111.1 hypothetical protein SAMN05216326_1529 [Nitrosomonas marina]
MANPALILLLLLFPVTLHAEIIDISQHSGIIRDSSGNYKTINGRGTISSISTGTQLQVQNRVPVPTSKGNQYVDISRTAVVDLARVGGALASLARKLTPVGIAIGTASYICQETNICDEAGEWLFNDTSGTAIVDGQNPSCDNAAHWPTVTTYTNLQTHLANPETLIQASVWCPNDHPGETQPAGWGVQTSCQTICAFGSLLSKTTPGGMPGGNPPEGEQRTPTDEDWNAAADQLNDAASTDHVLDNGGDVPVDVSTPPTLDAPIEKTIGTENKEIKDGQGNITGTETTETSIEITDAATSQNPNHLDLSETTTVTNYDINNNITNQTTTVTETAQPAPAEAPELDIQVEFDTVSDTELQEKEVEAPFDTASWGGGACPPDIEMSLSFGNHTFSSQPFCDFAISMKPIILLVASIVGAFIVITSARPATT